MYRDKRRLWLSWIDMDEHHAIWRELSSMVWTDVRFKMLTQFAINDENSALLGRTRLDDEMRAGRSAREREPLWFDHERSELLSLLLTASKAGCRRSEGEAPKAA
jgi:hypothetical protein